MKRLLPFLLLFSLVISPCIAQITTLGKPIKEEPKIIIPQYDSLTNFKADYDPNTGISSYKHLIGQKVYVVVENNMKEELRRWLLVLKLHEDDSYKIKGHYMTIVDGKRYKENDKYSWRNALDIAFQDETDGFIYCFDKKWYKNANNKMVIVGHYEKMKQLYEGKELVFVVDDSKDSDHVNNIIGNGIYDSNTRKRVESFNKGTTFTCTGVSIDDQKGDDWRSKEAYISIKDRVVILLRNDVLGDFYCYATSYDMTNEFDKKAQARYKKYILGKFLTPDDYAKKQKNDAIAAKKKKEEEKAKAEEAQAQAQERKEREQQRIQALVDKYGQTNVNLARQGKVKIGWNKELCKEAWGEPRSVNKTTTAYGVHEQWVYTTSRYLYFDDGVLTAIQE